MLIAVWADATFCPAEESESFRQEVGLSDDYKILSVRDGCTEDELWAVAEAWASLRTLPASLRTQPAYGNTARGNHPNLNSDA